MLAFDRPETPLGRLFASLGSGTSEAVLTDYIVAETRSTLAKPWFRRRLGDELTSALLDVLLAAASIIPVTIQVQGVAPHPKDDPIIAAALSAGVPYLVTGDRALRAIDQYRGVVFLSPVEFADLLPPV